MIKYSLYTRIGLLLICFFWLGTAVAYSAPKMVVPEPIHDFKEVKEGAVITHTFTVRNEGDQVLEIKAVKPG